MHAAQLSPVEPLLIASADLAAVDNEFVVPALVPLQVGRLTPPMLHDTPVGQQPLRQMGVNGK